MTKRLNNYFVEEDPSFYTFYFDGELGDDINGVGTVDNPWQSLDGLFNSYINSDDNKEVNKIYVYYSNDFIYNTGWEPPNKRGIIVFKNCQVQLSFKALTSGGVRQEYEITKSISVHNTSLIVQGYGDVRDFFNGSIVLYDNRPILRPSYYLVYLLGLQFASAQGEPIVGSTGISIYYNSNLMLSNIHVETSYNKMTAENWPATITDQNWYNPSSPEIYFTMYLETQEEYDNWQQYFEHADTGANPVDIREAVEWNELEKLYSVKDNVTVTNATFSDMYFNYSATTFLGGQANQNVQTFRCVITTRDTPLTYANDGLTDLNHAHYSTRFQRLGSVGSYLWNIGSYYKYRLSFYSCQTQDLISINYGNGGVNPVDAWNDSLVHFSHSGGISIVP